MLVTEAKVRLGSGTQLVLRSPREEEASLLLQFIRVMARESWRSLGSPPEHFDAMTDEEETELVAACARAPRSFLLTAWEGDAIVASLGMTAQSQELSAHCAELGMGVLRRWHRKGLGARMLGHALTEAERVGLWNVSLKVRVSNAPAIALYERSGFVRVGTMQKVALIEGALEDEHIYQRLGRSSGVSSTA